MSEEQESWEGKTLLRILFGGGGGEGKMGCGGNRNIRFGRGRGKRILYLLFDLAKATRNMENESFCSGESQGIWEVGVSGNLS